MSFRKYFLCSYNFVHLTLYFNRIKMSSIYLQYRENGFNLEHSRHHVTTRHIKKTKKIAYSNINLQTNRRTTEKSDLAQNTVLVRAESLS